MIALLLQLVLTASLQGRVLDWSTSLPVPEAEVELRSSTGNRSFVVVTDAEGRFRFTQVPQGDYRLQAQRAGFAAGEYGQRRPGGPGTSMQLKGGVTLDGVRLYVVREGVISGRLTDSLGRPLPRATVQALRFSRSEGKTRLIPAQSTLTDDRGQYRLFWLAPGQYYVGFFPTNSPGRMSTVIMDAAAPDASRPLSLSRGSRFSRQPSPDEDEIDLPVYFPGTPDPEGALLLNLGPGEEIRDVNVVALAARRVNVRVSAVNGKTGEIVTSRAPITLVSLALGSSPANGTISENEVTFKVPPGAYTVRGSLPAEDLSGHAVIEVRNEDLNLSLVLNSVSVTGRVRIQDSPPLFSLEHCRLILRAGDSFTVSGAIAADGSFRIDAVPPGDYSVSMSEDALQNTFIRSVRHDSAPITDADLRIGVKQSQSLEIELSGKGARLSGVVTNPVGAAIEAVTVVVIPDGEPNESRVKVTKSDKQGQFDIRGIAPGDYSVYAWIDPEPGSWLDPRFVELYRSDAISVELSEGSHQEVHLSTRP